ncbi:MAG: flagellar export protein FliJ [Methyloligellaceae bacterium]
MKSRETLMRLHRFDVDEKRRQVADIELMINEFRRMATDLDRQIEVEQEAAGVSDVNHYAYPTFAKAAIQRRDNLLASVAELEGKLDAARDELAAAVEELKKVELMDERSAVRDNRERNKREQGELDEVAANAHHGIYS